MAMEAEPTVSVITVADIGYQVWLQRRTLGMTQAQVAKWCGVGVRFLSDLENGKPTIETGRMLQVLSKLGLEVTIEFTKTNLPAS